MKHPVVCSMLKQLHDEYVSPVDASVALADFKLLVGKARARACQELLRATHASHGAKLSVAATAMTAHRNRHLATLLLCCEDGSSARLFLHWAKVFETLVDGDQHLLLRDRCQLCSESSRSCSVDSGHKRFDVWISAMKESAPGPDGLPYSVYRCAGPSVLCCQQDCVHSKILYGGGPGRIVRHPNAPRPLTLCNCECVFSPLLSTALSELQLPSSTLCLYKADDGQHSRD